MKKKACILISGGLDSCVLAADLARQGYEVHPLFLKSGILWEKAELFWLRSFLRAAGKKIKPLTVLESPNQDLYGGHWSITGKNAPSYHSPDKDCYIPGRNISLLSKAAVFCATRGIHAIALANLNCNPFPDGTPAFYKQMAKALSLGLDMPIHILTPYRQMSKSDVIRRAKKLPLHLTFSCITPKKLWHCGQCAKCAERHDAFLRAGLEDRTRYASPPEGLRIVR